MDERHDGLAKALVITGIVLVVTPLVLPLVAGLRMVGSPRGYTVDYLMPFEVYPVTLVGAALVVWASLRAKLRRRGVVTAVAVMLGGVLLGGVAAQVTGIANSPEQLETWRYVPTIALGVASLIAQVVLAVEGWLLARDLFHRGHGAPAPVTPTPDA